MFERFTNAARRVTILAQEEARCLDHDYIGAEHVLLGLAHEEDGVAAVALRSLGGNQDSLRRHVVTLVGRGASPSLSVYLPFTERTKRVLHGSVREALQLGRSHVDTEHILLGLVREARDDPTIVQLLSHHGVDLRAVRQAVLHVLSETIRLRSSA